MFNQLNQEDLPLHLTILGWLHIVGAALFLLMGVLLFMLLTGIGVASGESEAMAVLGVIGTTIGLLLGMLSIPGLAAGYGLLKHYAWARILAIVIGILSLMNFPLGTLISLYTFWVLLQESANGYFASPKEA
jgi:hypothetical protein